jgi:hypothetical protein
MRRSLRPTRPTCPPPTLPISLCERGQHDMQYYTVSGWEGSGGFGLASGGRHLHYREPSGESPIARGGYCTGFEPHSPRARPQYQSTFQRPTHLVRPRAALADVRPSGTHLQNQHSRRLKKRAGPSMRPPVLPSGDALAGDGRGPYCSGGSWISLDIRRTRPRAGVRVWDLGHLSCGSRMWDGSSRLGIRDGDA